MSTRITDGVGVFTGTRGSGVVDNVTVDFQCTEFGVFGVTPIIQKDHLADPAAIANELRDWAAAVNLVLEQYGLVKS